MSESPIAVKITKDGQIPLPEQLLRDLGLAPLQKVLLFRRGDELVVQPVSTSTSLREWAEAILLQAKVRAAALASEVTMDEAWAIYDRAAAALEQVLEEGSSADDA
jgi:bifunctional DNA-binding transcriptional regulator/antitoxin component of YhaV-PrlF toxin-antitoxin module